MFKRKDKKFLYGDLTNRLCAVSLDLAILYFPLTFITEFALNMIFPVRNQFDITKTKIIARFPEAASDGGKLLQYMLDYYPRDLEMVLRQLLFVTAFQIIILAIYVVPMIYKYGATLGKMAVGIKVVDVITEGKLTLSQSVIRFIGYVVSCLPLFLGIMNGGFRHDKRCWHDFLADTIVIYDPNRWYKKSMDRAVSKVRGFFNLK